MNIQVEIIRPVAIHWEDLQEEVRYESWKKFGASRTVQEVVPNLLSPRNQEAAWYVMEWPDGQPEGKYERLAGAIYSGPMTEFEACYGRPETRVFGQFTFWRMGETEKCCEGLLGGVSGCWWSYKENRWVKE